MRIKPGSLTFVVKRKEQELYVLLNHPTDAARMAHNATHSEIGAQSVLRVSDEVLRTSCGEQDGGYAAEIPHLWKRAVEW